MAVHWRNVVLLVFFASLTWAAQYGPAVSGDAKLIDMKLTLTWGKEGNYEIPYFNIVITNISDKRVRALDIRNRPDFVDSYVNVDIVPLDRSFELSRAIADPNEINDNDFVELSPGEILEFKSIILPIDYREIVPGKYVAQAEYRIDPVRWPLEIYKSDEVIFEMK